MISYISKPHRNVLYIACLLVLTCSLFCCMFNISSTYCYAENFTTDWKQTNVEVGNNINDYTFTIPAIIRWDIVQAGYIVKIKVSDVQERYSNFLLPGYTNKGLCDFSLDDNNEYYIQYVSKIEGYKVMTQYIAKANTITFVDSLTNEVIQEFAASTSQSIVAPEAPTHSGYTFVKWEGGDYENVSRSAAVYAVYAPTRVITVNINKKENITINGYYGETYSDFVAAAEAANTKNHRWFKCFKDENGKKIKLDSTVIENQTITAVYTSTANGYLFGISWYWWLAAATVLIVLFLIFVNRG